MTKVKVGLIFAIALFPFLEFLIRGDSIVLPQKIEQTEQIIYCVVDNNNNETCYQIIVK